MVPLALFCISVALPVLRVPPTYSIYAFLGLTDFLSELSIEVCQVSKSPIIVFTINFSLYILIFALYI